MELAVKGRLERDRLILQFALGVIRKCDKQKKDTLKDIHILIPGTCRYVSLFGRGELGCSGIKGANQLTLK